MNPNTTRSYKDLVVSQKGIALAKLVYWHDGKARDAFDLIAELRRMLNVLRRKLATRE
jgi:hypothetical protein